MRFMMGMEIGGSCSKQKFQWCFFGFLLLLVSRSLNRTQSLDLASRDRIRFAGHEHPISKSQKQDAA